MSDALSPPKDLEDRHALAEWAQRIGDYFRGLSHQRGLECATELATALVETPPNLQRISDAVKAASEQLVRAGLESSRDAYQQLMLPTQSLHDQLPEGSANRERVEKSLETFRAVIALFEQALAGLDRGGPEGKKQMEKAVADAQARIEAIPK